MVIFYFVYHGKSKNIFKSQKSPQINQNCAHKFIGRYQDSLCETNNCIRAASNLMQSMDFTANPCTDFYQFTCGNWAEDHPR